MHEVRITGTAERQLKRLSVESRGRVSRAVKALALKPLPDGRRKLTGHDDVYWIRVGRFRILYCVNHSTHIVTVLKIGDRKRVYR